MINIEGKQIKLQIWDTVSIASAFLHIHMLVIPADDIDHISVLLSLLC